MADKEITIIIDGTPHQWNEKEISYEQVVDLAYDGNPLLESSWRSPSATTAATARSRKAISSQATA